MTHRRPRFSECRRARIARVLRLGLAVVAATVLAGCAGLANKQRGTAGHEAHGPQLPSVESSASQPGGGTYEVQDFAPDRIVDTTKRMAGVRPNEQHARDLYRDAEELFRQQEYGSAKKKYKAAARRWPDSTLEEDALYKLAECEYFLDRWPTAVEAYEAVLKKYPNGQYLERINRRRFTIAQGWQSHAQERNSWALTPNLLDKKRPLFDTHGRALKTYEAVMMSDVRGELADHSLLAVADAYLRRGRYEDADFRYTMLINDHPQSQHQYVAHMNSLRCKLLKYQRFQGPDYDGTGLDKANDLIEQMLLQFPEMKLEDRDFLTSTRAKIFAMKAEEDWRVAEYFAKNKHYGAARIYYQEIARRYPNTPHAQWSLARADEYRDKPDVAPHPLAWAWNWIPGDSPEGSEATRVVSEPTQPRRR